jgi:hypothetical protein
MEGPDLHIHPLRNLGISWDVPRGHVLLLEKDRTLGVSGEG